MNLEKSKADHPNEPTKSRAICQPQMCKSTARTMHVQRENHIVLQ